MGDRLRRGHVGQLRAIAAAERPAPSRQHDPSHALDLLCRIPAFNRRMAGHPESRIPAFKALENRVVLAARSEEHTSELHSLMRSSYAASCLQQNNHASNPHLRLQNIIYLTNTLK